MTISAVAVDDATVIRESLPLLMPEIRFVARYATVEHLLVERPAADLAVLDLHLVNERQPSVRQGIAAVRAAVAAGYRVCVYSQEERRFVLAACIAAGAGGIVPKSAPLTEVQQSFRDVAAGRVVVPQSIISLMEILVRRDCITIIGERQRQVLAARARGLTYAEISTKLFLSESTLRGYWRDLTLNVSTYLQQTTPHDIEHALGLKPGDLLDIWPMQPSTTDRPNAEWWKLS